jgi:hypothetical protein
VYQIHESVSVGILRVNRQIKDEAIGIMQKKLDYIDSTPIRLIFDHRQSSHVQLNNQMPNQDQRDRCPLTKLFGAILAVNGYSREPVEALEEFLSFRRMEICRLNCGRGLKQRREIYVNGICHPDLWDDFCSMLGKVLLRTYRHSTICIRLPELPELDWSDDEKELVRPAMAKTLQRTMSEIPGWYRDSTLVLGENVTKAEFKEVWAVGERW